MASGAVRQGRRVERERLLLTGTVFAAALLSRSAWFPAAPFHPDESTILWIALDAVRAGHLPDHGLVSSFLMFQPPGLAWLTMPLVAVGGGRPEPVIVGFALANASGIAFLVATVARFWGLLYAGVLGVFLVVGPDAFFSSWIWHPGLFTAATATMLAAGIRLRPGSVWWASVLIAIPGIYALVHYSGFVLFGSALGLLALSGRRVTSMFVPALVAAALVLIAWAPFLVFEQHRHWIDLQTLVDASDDSSSIRVKIEDRIGAARFALSHLGESLHGTVHLTTAMRILVGVALVLALARRRWSDPAFSLPAGMLAAGIFVQLLVDQGQRTDVLLIWHVPIYALAAWGAVESAALVRRVSPTASVAVVCLLLAGIAMVGGSDLANSVRATPLDERLGEKWRRARVDAQVAYDASRRQAHSPNAYYLPCDPPWDWGSEVWYLREVLDPGSGRRAAAAAGAFRWREHACTSR